MHRRPFLASAFFVPALLGPALALPTGARAQAADRLPPEAPGSAPRDDVRFSAELLAGMAAGEAEARERLSRFGELRVLRRQVARRGWGGVDSHYTQALAVERRWRNAGITQPQRTSYPTFPPQGWTDGKLVLALVGAHTTRAENDLLPYSLLTNLRDA